MNKSSSIGMFAMSKIIIAGIGTEVGKTIVSAIMATKLGADYWKPVECGSIETSDTAIVKKLINPVKHQIHTPAYSFKTPVSPHHAARLENSSIKLDSIIPPVTTKPLIIESVGGILVPLTSKLLSIDLFKNWNCTWIIVSKHYLGSINHTLLTIEALKRRNSSIAGLIFNGQPQQDSERAILEISQLPLLGRLLPEKTINIQTIQKYAKKWKICPLLLPL